MDVNIGGHSPQNHKELTIHVCLSVRVHIFFVVASIADKCGPTANAYAVALTNDILGSSRVTQW